MGNTEFQPVSWYTDETELGWKQHGRQFSQISGCHFFHAVALILERPPLLWSRSWLWSRETHSLLLVSLFSFSKSTGGINRKKKNSIFLFFFWKILFYFASDLIIFQPYTETPVYVFIRVSNSMAASGNVGYRSKKFTGLQKSKARNPDPLISPL